MGGWIIDHHGLVAIGCTLIIARLRLWRRLYADERQPAEDVP